MRLMGLLVGEAELPRAWSSPPLPPTSLGTNSSPDGCDEAPLAELGALFPALPPLTYSL